MPLKNYSTKVSAQKTVGEIMDILRKNGATEILMEYRSSEISGVSFRVDAPHGKLAFTLPLNLDAIHQTLSHQWGQGNGVRSSQATIEHARRVGWRIIKDWLDAQMALLETKMVEFEQIFLPYMQVNRTQNLYEHMLEDGFQVALPPGESS